MEHIASILQAINIPELCLLAIIIAIAVYLVRSGIISIKSNHVRIGIDEKERTTAQRQTTFVHTQMDAIIAKLIHDHPEFDIWRTKYICRCVEIEWIRSIHYNHIVDTEGYKNDRFVQLKAIVQKNAEHEFFFSPQFDEYLKSSIALIVPNLVRIREEMK